jgi:uncharacterized protein (TIGR03067 family)
MKRRGLILFGAALLLAADSPKADDKKEDKDLIQGTWVLVSGERGGKPLPDEIVKGAKMTFAGDKITIKTKDREIKGTFKLDPSKKPKAMDVKLDGNDGQGIYSLEGDTLKIAHGADRDPRPTEFATKENTNLVLLVLKREKPAAPKEDEVKKELAKMEGTWTIVIHESNGKKQTDEEVKAVKMKLVVKGDKYTVFLDDKPLTQGTLKLDPSKKPKTIDAVADDGPFKGTAMPGIYELEGDDMKVNFGQPGAARPTEFKTKEGSNQVLIGYKRVKP